MKRFWDIKNGFSNKNFDVFFDIFFIIILFLFSLLLLSCVGFLFNIPINKCYSIISAAICIFCAYFSCKKSCTKENVFKISFLIFIILLSAVCSLYFYDFSYDGRYYHQPGIVLLGEGWNPVFYNLENPSAGGVLGSGGILGSGGVFGSTEVSYKLYELYRHSFIWVENYPKGIEILASNIYLIFKRVDAGKIIGYLSLWATFCLSLYTFSKFKINAFVNAVLSALIVLNPVCLCQVRTFYNDFFMYLFFLNLVLLVIIREKAQAEESRVGGFCKISGADTDAERDGTTEGNGDMTPRNGTGAGACRKIIFLFVANLVLLSDVKLGGALYSLLFLIIYGVYIFGSEIFFKNKVGNKAGRGSEGGAQKAAGKGCEFLFVVSSFVVLFLITGVNPYFTNLMAGKHPLHPLYTINTSHGINGGENAESANGNNPNKDLRTGAHSEAGKKVNAANIMKTARESLFAGKKGMDIITENSPYQFEGKNSLYKLFYSTFGASKNVTYRRDKRIRLKIPFSILKKEGGFGNPDMRIGGFGYFWSGILILSLIFLFVSKYEERRGEKNSKNTDKGLFYLTFTFLLACVLLNPEGWWARYSPQFWAFPVFIILYALKEHGHKRWCKIYSAILMIVIVANIAAVEAQNLHASIKYAEKFRRQISTMKKVPAVLVYEGKSDNDKIFYQKLDENNIAYVKIDKKYYTEHKEDFEAVSRDFEGMMINIKEIENISLKESIKGTDGVKRHD